MPRLLPLCCTLAFLLSTCPSINAAEAIKQSWNIDGIKREAFIYLPINDNGHETHPLVFVFHGHGGNAQNIARTMPIQTLWPESIVVYMQGIPTPTRIDPEGKKSGWQRAPGEVGGRDLKFFDAVLASIRHNYNVDDKRIYATGFSNGSLFTFLLWAERPNIFAAFAPCAGPPTQGVNLRVPKPAFIVAGKADNIVPIANQQATIDRIRKLNSATNPPKSRDEGVEVYESRNGATLQTLVHDGGHVLPREAPKLIVDFFRAHQLSQAPR